MKTGLAFAIATLALATSASAGIQDFTVHNESGFGFETLYVESSTEDEWGEDILGVETLPSGESQKINFAGYGEQCEFDIRVTDVDGNAWDLMAVDLCKMTDVVFVKDGDKLVAVEFEDGPGADEDEDE